MRRPEKQETEPIRPTVFFYSASRNTVLGTVSVRLDTEFRAENEFTDYYRTYNNFVGRFFRP